MALVEGALVAFAAMLMLGVCDFWGKKAVDELGDFPALLWTQALGFIPLIAYVALFTTMPLLSTDTLLLLVFAGLVNFFAWLVFYKGLGEGMASVVVPISL